MTTPSVNLYTQDKLREEHYIARLNEIAEPFGHMVKEIFGLSIIETERRSYARVDYRGDQFQINTTSSTYTVHEASNYIQELQSAINLTEYLNEALIHIKEEIYHRYLDEYPNA